ncbi:hypothetical protein LPJ59_003112, partial [Coemansia sp. RSA 2399]
MSDKIHRPSYIGIHSRDESTQILYISSGCRQSIGFTPAEIVSKNAHDFIADPYSNNYASIYETSEEEQAEDDEANAFVMYVNIRTANGDPVLHRATTFKCDNCVIFICVGFHELPYQSKHELDVQMLDGAMKRMNITHEKEARQRDVNNHQQAAARWRERAESEQGQRVPLYRAQSRQIKAAFVLENQSATEILANEGIRRQNGPLVVF